MTKVIVVDDDPTNVTLTQMLLELDGFTVTACTNLQQAMQATQEGADAYVVDVNLSRGESGLDFLTAVRAGETPASKDVIFIITSGDHRRKREAKEAGASKFLLKPYPPEGLSTIINELIAGEQNG
ncbi:MAG: response regulator [Ardenticatenaceae bacterium]|nr:response regulator [Anaerolineales bacterium]MCB8921907.1 response regulator [Ardenticatenaceae bacterium]MCB8989482.1 response regulator [Ardenticatenaceae bacterium]